jgi:hypothetical protein
MGMKRSQMSKWIGQNFAGKSCSGHMDSASADVAWRLRVPGWCCITGAEGRGVTHAIVSSIARDSLLDAMTKHINAGWAHRTGARGESRWQQFH